MYYCIDIFISELSEEESQNPFFMKENLIKCINKIIIGNECDESESDGGDEVLYNYETSKQFLINNLNSVSYGKRLPWQDCFIALSMQQIIPKMWSKLNVNDKN